MEINRSALLPNLLTLSNGVCGFAAIIRLSKIEVEDGTLVHAQNFTIAAYLIMLGMVFDVFDGKLARTFGGGSELGAQLDSLCDLITFGLAPAFMIVRLNLAGPPGWQYIVWFFALAYFLGALMRLARFNVENSPDESAHLAFKGLPTPAAAGCVASLVLLLRYLFKFEAVELAAFEDWMSEERREATRAFLTYVTTFLAPVLGFTMVASGIRFDHMGSKLLGRRRSFDSQVYVIFAALALAMVPELVLPAAFLGYLCWSPCRWLLRFAFGAKLPEGASEETT